MVKVAHAVGAVGILSLVRQHQVSMKLEGALCRIHLGIVSLKLEHSTNG